MSNNHHHHHKHDSHGQMPFDEKLLKMIKHRIKHKKDLALNYRNWAAKAKTNGRAEAREIFFKRPLRCLWQLMKGFKKPWQKLEMNRSALCRGANDGGLLMFNDESGVRKPAAIEDTRYV